MTVHIGQPYPHAMMPQADHDELARQNITLSMKMHMTETVYPGDELVYEHRAKPRFVRDHNRPPEDKTEVRHLMMEEPYTQMWSSIARSLQEILWDNTSACVERQLPELIDKARGNGAALGTLRVDPDFQVPRYLSAVDIHCMPGSYGSDLADGDVYAGAVYDRGAYYYSKGLPGPLNDGAGRALTEVFKRLFPKMKPRRILDLGCAIGATTVPWAEAFPGAEVYGIDVGAGILRYAHSRAEDLGVALHFSQQSGESTDFADGFFDVVATAGVFHETSGRGSRNIMREVRRLLAPGGVSINSDIPHQHANNLHDQFMLDWDCHYNAEPFWAQWTAMTSIDLMRGAGFDPDTVFELWRERDHKGGFTLHDKAKNDPSESNGGGVGKGITWGAKKAA